MRSSIAAMHELYARALGDGTCQQAEEMSLEVCGTINELLSYLENLFHLADTSFMPRWRSKPWGEHPAGNAGSGLLRRLEGIQHILHKRTTSPLGTYV